MKINEILESQAVIDIKTRYDHHYGYDPELLSYKLEIGKITTIKVKVLKYNFPRLRNLPSKVICEDKIGNIDNVRNYYDTP